MQTKNEQEKILTPAISMNIQLYRSFYRTHLQAILSTVKSHDHSTFKKKKTQLQKKKKRGRKKGVGVYQRAYASARERF